MKVLTKEVAKKLNQVRIYPYLAENKFQFIPALEGCFIDNVFYTEDDDLHIKRF